MKHIDIESLGLKLERILTYGQYILPEFLLVSGILVALLLALLPAEKNRYLSSAIVLLVLVAVAVLYGFQWVDTYRTGVKSLLGMLRLHTAAVTLKLLFTLTTAAVVLLSLRLSSLRQYVGEYLVLLLTALLGAVLMVMSSNLLMTYLSIEMVSIASYALTGFAFTKKSAEGGLKYILFGAVASGLMLYGMSLHYGLTGSLELGFRAVSEGELLLSFGSILMLGGFLFKLAAVPFHVWAPDVYEAAPTPVTAFFSIVPKIAGMAVLVTYTRIFLEVDMLLLSGQETVRTLLATLAILSLLLGNFSAIWQSDPKRLLAYSGIAHSGFLLAGIAAFSHLGIKSLLFYAVIYAIMNLAAFALLHWAEYRYGIRRIEDFKGLSQKAPFGSLLLLVVMVALTGLPPTAGFTAKLFVFMSLWDAYGQTGESILLWLLVFALVNTLIALFYYLKIPYFVYFKPMKDNGQAQEKPLSSLHMAVMVLVLFLLMLFFKPEWLMDFFNNASFVF